MFKTYFIKTEVFFYTVYIDHKQLNVKETIIKKNVELCLMRSKMIQFVSQTLDTTHAVSFLLKLDKDIMSLYFYNGYTQVFVLPLPFSLTIYLAQLPATFAELLMIINNKIIINYNKFFVQL